jgi:hypothetical protein
MKNGTTRRGKQNYKCRDCGRQFVEDSQWQPKDPDTNAIIDRLLLERIPLAGITRVLQLSESWLQQYVNRAYETVPKQATVTPTTTARLTVQMDELWSFVNIPLSPQKSIVLEKIREPYWCHLDLHPSLQSEDSQEAPTGTNALFFSILYIKALPGFPVSDP